MSENEQNHEFNNIAEPEAIKKNLSKEKRRALREQADLKHVLSSKEGRAVIWRYLEECGIFQSSMGLDAWIYFKEGKRSIGLKLLQEVMSVDESKYLLMAKEAKELKE